MVGSKIANLTPGLFFSHDLCFRCPNEQCKPIFDIYASISFQWYKKLFGAMGFDPWNYALKIRESIWDSNSQHWSSLGNMRVHSLTLFALLGECEVTPRSPSWPATLQPLALVVSPRLGLRQIIISLAMKKLSFNFSSHCPIAPMASICAVTSFASFPISLMSFSFVYHSMKLKHNNPI